MRRSNECHTHTSTQINLPYLYRSWLTVDVNWKWTEQFFLSFHATCKFLRLKIQFESHKTWHFTAYTSDNSTETRSTSACIYSSLVVHSKVVERKLRGCCAAVQWHAAQATPTADSSKIPKRRRKKNRVNSFHSSGLSVYDELHHFKLISFIRCTINLLWLISFLLLFSSSLAEIRRAEKCRR